MADDIDLAVQLAHNNECAVVNQKPLPTAANLCQECLGPVNDGQRWCSKRCCEDWQHWNPEA